MTTVDSRMQKIIELVVGQLICEVLPDLKSYHLEEIAQITNKVDKILSHRNKRRHKMVMIKRCCAGGMDVRT